MTAAQDAELTLATPCSHSGTWIARSKADLRVVQSVRKCSGAPAVRRAADHVEDHCVQPGVGQCWHNAVPNSIFLALFALPLWAVRGQ